MIGQSYSHLVIVEAFGVAIGVDFRENVKWIKQYKHWCTRDPKNLVIVDEFLGWLASNTLTYYRLVAKHDQIFWVTNIVLKK